MVWAEIISMNSCHGKLSVGQSSGFVEHFTTHPIGAALRPAFPQEATDGCEVTDVEEIAGQGIRCV